MKINRCISKFNHEHMDNKKNKYIIVHYVGALGDAKANAEYYCGGDRQASANYYVGHSGDVYQVVEDFDRAWSAGVNFGGKLWGIVSDYNSISIEMCVHKKSTKTLLPTDKDWYFTKETVNATAELIKMKMKQYNIPIENVVRHFDVCNKLCPNPYCDSLHPGAWDKFKALLTDKYEKPISNGTVVVQKNVQSYKSNRTTSTKVQTVRPGTYNYINKKTSVFHNTYVQLASCKDWILIKKGYAYLK